MLHLSPKIWRPPRRALGIRGLKTAGITEQAYPVPLDAKLRARARIAQVDAEKGVSPFLVDTFQRQHNYLRISLTERCNLRCFYCMPSEGVELSPNGNILTDDEVVRLAGLFVKNGVKKIRLTGGEPTVRKGLVDIVARLNELRQHGLESIGMTTNGIVLHRRLPDLVANGLTHLNISLDTLDPFKFEIMTRRMGHDAVLRAIDTALSSSLSSVKLNVVVIKGLNDAEVLDFVAMTKNKALSVRFIEFMPFTGNKWDKDKMVPSSELLARIVSRYPAVMKAPDELNDTARNYVIPGHLQSTATDSRWTNQSEQLNRDIWFSGRLMKRNKVCLFDPKEISLRDPMRLGATDSQLLQTIGRAVQGKREKHAGMEDIDTVTNRPMILIGASLRPGLLRTGRARVQGLPPYVVDSSRSTRTQRCYNSTHGAASDSRARLTHIDSSGRPSMVDVSPKEPTKRTASARGRVYIPKIAYDLITGPRDPHSAGSPSSASSSSAKLDKATAKTRSKGDVLTVAQLAAIMASKRTSDLIPLCHPLQLSHVHVELAPDASRAVSRSPSQLSEDVSDAERSEKLEVASVHDPERPQYSIVCTATVTCEGKTGVEMEALTAVSVGLLTVWDMLKAVAGKEMIIGDIVVLEKRGREEW
ncbi:hypothetical protein NM688_g8028 [Phlebia brevispora]|uniref:Uncharacterized protein n=1 Tax=Phlebia brevispora TaxID=194682 RepID=A0ACC1RYI0_9APHY|nr:hypothetical protein NM688_g8028 [Phlebia brevispora]